MERKMTFVLSKVEFLQVQTPNILSMLRNFHDLKMNKILKNRNIYESTTWVQTITMHQIFKDTVS